MGDIFDQIAEEVTSGRAVTPRAPDIFDQIAEEVTSSTAKPPADLYGTTLGVLKGVAKAGTDVVTAPADLLFRGGMGALDYIRGKDTNLQGAYPSDYRDKFLNWISQDRGDESAENVSRLVGNLATVVAAPSQAKNIASSIPVVSKAAETSKIANLLAKTIGYGTEGAAYGALFNTKDENLGEKAAEGAAWNIAVPAALQVTGNLARGLSSKFMGAADETLEKGLGVQYGERTKGLNRVNLFVNEAGDVVPFDKLDDAVGVQAPIQQQIKTLEDAGILTNAPDDVQALKLHITKEASEMGKNIPRLVDKADEVIGSKEILPDFEVTQNFLTGYRPETRAKLASQFDAIVNDYIEAPGSGMKKLTKFTDQLQKETRFDSATPAEVTQLKRMIQYDFRKAAEREFDSAVPALKGEFAKANSIYSAAQAIGKTLNKPLARQKPTLGDYITGGSLPMTVMTGLLSSPLGFPIAATVSGARLLKNAIQQYAEAAHPISTSNIYKALASKSAGAARTTENLKGAAKAIVGVASSDEPTTTNTKEQNILPMRETPKGQLFHKPIGAPLSQRQQSSSSFNPTSATTANQSDYGFMNTLFKGNKMDKQAVEIIEQIKQDPVDHAIMLMESGGDPNAKNPDSSASGLFQLIKKTAGALGVKDVFDPAQNYEGYKKLKAAAIKNFGSDDPATIYAAHYLGEPTMRKWLSGEALTDEQEKQVAYLQTVLLPRLQKIYAELTGKDVVEA